MSAETSAERPLRADARRNKERVLVAAREAFAEFGTEAQMDDVARRAGVGVGTVYRHFPTKDELVVALAERHFRVLTEIAREESVRPDAWEAFCSVLRRGAATQSGDRAMQEVIMSGLGSAAVDAARAELIELISEMMDRAKAAGHLREDVHHLDIPMIMCGVSASQRLPFGAGGAWRRHLELVLAGMQAPAATPLPPR